PPQLPCQSVIGWMQPLQDIRRHRRVFTLDENRNVASFRNFDDQALANAFCFEVLLHFCTQLAGGTPDNAVIDGIVVRPPLENLPADFVLADIVCMPAYAALGDKQEKLAKPR